MQKEQERFWSLLEPVYDELAGFCIKLAGDSDRGNDLLHDALVKASNRIDQLRDEESLRPWLYRIVVTTYRSQFRTGWFIRKVAMTEEIIDNISGADPRESHHAKRLVQTAFKVLSAEAKAMMILYEVEGWSIAEISGMMNKSESAIKVGLMRTRKKMKDAILKLTAANEKKETTVLPGRVS